MGDIRPHVRFRRRTTSVDQLDDAPSNSIRQDEHVEQSRSTTPLYGLVDRRPLPTISIASSADDARPTTPRSLVDQTTARLLRAIGVDLCGQVDVKLCEQSASTSADMSRRLLRALRVEFYPPPTAKSASPK
ncbi:unnamed protein product [Closterium sp. NIES-53]